MPEDDAGLVFDRAIRWVKAQGMAVAFLGTVVGPASFTLVLVFRDQVKSQGFLLGLIGLTLLVWALGAVFATLGPRTPLSLMRDNQSKADTLRQARRELAQTQDLHRVNAQRVEVVRRWLDLVAAYVADGRIDRREFDNALHLVLNLLVRRPQELFVEGCPGYWTVSVYLYDVRDDRLHAVARQTSEETAPQRKGRTWPNGKGHVGFAYQQDMRIVVRDMANSELTQHLHTPESLRRPDDSRRYRCMAALPLRADDLNGSIGCLVVTSDQVDSLSETGDQDILASAAALVYILIRLHPDDIVTIIDRKGKDRIDV